MDKVKDLILYQVATNRNYKVGETFVFDKNTKNGQYEKVLTLVLLMETQDFVISCIKYLNQNLKGLKKVSYLKLHIA